MGEPEKRERLGFPFSSMLPVNLREPTKLDQSRLLWMNLQPELCQPFLKLSQKSLGFGSVLESDHEVSSAGESHPDALSEPYVNVSAHTAPAREPRRTPICQCANSLGSRREMRATQCVALRKCRRSFLYFR